MVSSASSLLCERASVARRARMKARISENERMNDSEPQVADGLLLRVVRESMSAVETERGALMTARRSKRDNARQSKREHAHPRACVAVLDPIACVLTTNINASVLSSRCSSWRGFVDTGDDLRYRFGATVVAKQWRRPLALPARAARMRCPLAPPARAARSHRPLAPSARTRGRARSRARAAFCACFGLFLCFS